MNYGYAGTRELNEALTSRFAVRWIPAIDGDNLERLLTEEFPTLEKKYREQFVQLFWICRKSARMPRFPPGHSISAACWMRCG